MSTVLQFARVVMRRARAFCLAAPGGHRLRLVEPTGAAHPGLGQPEWPSLGVGPAQERPHHQSQRPQQPSTSLPPLPGSVDSSSSAAVRPLTRPLCCCCCCLDALLRSGVEPGSRHSAGLVVGGRPDAGHPDVGPAFRYLSFQDFREPHPVNTAHQFGAGAA